MSRHTIAGSPRIVVGFDRPLGEFFIQVYTRRGDLKSAETLWDPEVDLPLLLGSRLSADVIDALATTLLSEAAGVSDTNAITTWGGAAASPC